MADPVKIPLASAEYQVRFERPHVGFIGHDRVRAFEAVFTALLPFNLRLENTEVVTTGTPADHKAVFRIPERRISFQYGAEDYRLNKEAAFWAEAEKDGEILIAAEQALMEGSTAQVGLCIVTVAMHLQPVTKTREEILAPFFPQPYKVLEAQRPIQAYAYHIRWADGDVLMDYSVGFANGIFLRFITHFKGKPPLSEVLKKVRSEQDTIFGILGVEEATDE
jgi:hypothetical protein